MRMLISLMAILTVGGVSLHFTNLSSESLLYSRWLVLLDFLAIVALLIRFVALFYRLGIKQRSSASLGLFGMFTGED